MAVGWPGHCCEVTTEEVTAALFLAVKPGEGGGMLAPCSAGEKAKSLSSNDIMMLSSNDIMMLSSNDIMDVVIQ